MFNDKVSDQGVDNVVLVDVLVSDLSDGNLVVSQGPGIEVIKKEVL